METAGAALMQDVQALGDLACDLELDGTALHVGKAALQQHFAVVHDAHVVTDVFQLSQVVGRDQDGGATLGNIGEDQAPDLAAHDGVQTVHGLVQDQHIGAAADGQVESRLLLHTLGEPADLALPGQVEDFVEPLVQVLIEIGVNTLIILVHLLHGGGGEVEDLVGDGGDALLQDGIFVNGLAFHGDLAAVGAVDAGQVADGGGLACAVGAHETVDGALGDGHGQIVQGLEIAEGLGDVFHFKHVQIPSFWMRSDSAFRVMPI